MFSNVLSLFWIVSSIVVFVVTMWLLSGNKYASFIGSSSLLEYIVTFLGNNFLFGKLKQKPIRNKETNSRSQNKRQRQEDGQGGMQNASNGHFEKFTVTATIPKSWFCHFYILGAIVHPVVFSCLILILMGAAGPHTVRKISYWINLGNDKRGLVDNAWPLLIVFTLEFVQILRRLYECLFINNFSNSTMSIFHYFYGIFLYSSYGIGLLSSVNLEMLVLTKPDAAEVVSYFLGVCLFFWGTYYQNKSMLTFASLRKEKKNEYNPNNHYIPHGHLFKWVSCPHYLCEILIYLAFCIVFQFSNLYVLSVTLFVWSNQISSSLLVHKWYRENFSEYPATRKAVIPYIL